MCFNKNQTNTTITDEMINHVAKGASFSRTVSSLVYKTIKSGLRMIRF